MPETLEFYDAVKHTNAMSVLSDFNKAQNVAQCWSWNSFLACSDIKDELRGVKGKAVIGLLGSYDPQGRHTVTEYRISEYGRLQNILYEQQWKIESVRDLVSVGKISLQPVAFRRSWVYVKT